jgi:hypothetical protein
MCCQHKAADGATNNQQCNAASTKAMCRVPVLVPSYAHHQAQITEEQSCHACLASQKVTHRCIPHLLLLQHHPLAECGHAVVMQG